VSDDTTDHQKRRAALYLLLCLVIGAVGGVGIAAVKSWWGEGLASHALFLASLLFFGVMLARLLGVHPSQRRNPADGQRADG
jgi:hypothetical protein